MSHFPQLRRQLLVSQRLRLGQFHARVGEPLKVGDERRVLEVHDALPELLALVVRERAGLPGHHLSPSGSPRLRLEFLDAFFMA